MNNFTHKFLAVVLLTASTTLTFAQVRVVNSSVNSAAPNSSAFIDASSNSVVNNVNNPNLGKGLLFPRTDLSLFTDFGFSGGAGIPTNYATRYDGMIVYNTKVGGVAGAGLTQGTLTEGYWFYENKSTSLSGGTWKPLTAAPVSPTTNVLIDTETVTNLQFNGAPVYMKKGTFTTNGSSTAPTAYSSKVAIPGSTASVYRITIYKAGTGSVYANSVYSFNTTTGDLVTGSPSISVVYPADTYNYIVEYLK